MIVHIKTETGFECDFEKEAFNDMELLEAIEDMDKGEAMAFVPFVRKLFKPEDKARLYDYVREPDGRVPPEKIGAVIHDIIQALPDAEKK